MTADTSAALDHLAALIEEAPARADLRDTAERWARVLRRRAHEARDAVPKPRRVTWPAPLRAANQLLRIGDAQLQNGEMIAAARSFEKGRAAWARLADVVAARRDGRVGAQASRIDPAPTPRCARGRGGCGSAHGRRARCARAPSVRDARAREGVRARGGRCGSSGHQPDPGRIRAGVRQPQRRFAQAHLAVAVERRLAVLPITVFADAVPAVDLHRARHSRGTERQSGDCGMHRHGLDSGGRLARDPQRDTATSGSSSNASDRSGSLPGCRACRSSAAGLKPRPPIAAWSRAGSIRRPRSRRRRSSTSPVRRRSAPPACAPQALDEGAETRAGRQRELASRPAR